MQILEDCKLFSNFLITVLDDGSSDNSRDIINNIVSKYDHIRLVTSNQPSGIMGAVSKLISSTENKWIYVTSGDGQYPAVLLKSLFEKFDELAWVHIVKRTNKLYVYSILRFFVSSLYRFFTRVLSGYDSIDPGSTKLVRRQLFEGTFYCKHLAKDAELIIKAQKKGQKIVIVNENFQQRSYGKSSVKLHLILETFIDSLHLLKYRFKYFVNADD